MKIYNTIEDLPLYNYGKILSSHDLRYLIHDIDIFDLPALKEQEWKELMKAWEDLNAQIIDYVGISVEYKNILQLERDIALLEIEKIIKEDDSLETIIELKRIELNTIKPQTKQTIDESIIILERHYKMQIDEKKTSVKKYFAYLKHIKPKTNEE